MRRADLTGQRFGHWVALQYAGSIKWLCRCDCGAVQTVHTGGLVYGNSTRCWECKREAKKTHGLSETPEYKIWGGIIKRCYNPRNRAYRLYGGRGIVVCDRWRHDAAAFVADMGPRPSTRHSVDRIDNDGPYSPENCRWATYLEQGQNTTRSRKITHDGETLTAAAWARRLGVTWGAVEQRLSRGQSFAEAVEGIRSGAPATQKTRARWDYSTSSLTAVRLREVLHYDPDTGEFSCLRGLRQKVGRPNATGHIQISVDDRRYQAHRLVWLYMTGEWPRLLVHHIDGDPANNRWSNLQQVTPAENVSARFSVERAHG